MKKRDKKTGRFSKKFSKNIEKEILLEYKKGKTSTQLGEKYGCNQSTIIDIVRRNGGDIRPQHNKSIYTFDIHWLDKMDSPEKFYFLGLSYANGCIETESRYALGLQEIDEKLLIDLNKLLKSDRPLVTDEKSHREKSSRQIIKKLRLTNKHFCERLQELGCVQTKSLILQWPNWIEDTLYVWSFVRGCFDGDGSIVLNKNKNGTYRATINYTGAKNFCDGMKLFLEKNELKVSKIEHKTYSDLRIKEIKSVKKFLECIYKEKSIYLERKYQRAVTFLNSRDFTKETTIEKHQRLIRDNKKIIELYQKGESATQISKKFDCYPSTILKILRNYNIKIK